MASILEASYETMFCNLQRRKEYEDFCRRTYNVVGFNSLIYTTPVSKTKNRLRYAKSNDRELRELFLRMLNIVQINLTLLSAFAIFAHNVRRPAPLSFVKLSLSAQIYYFCPTNLRR